MPYELSVDEEGKGVVVRLSGSVTPGEHRAARSAAARLCVERGFRRLLVDLHELVGEGISTTSCYDFGESLPRKGLPAGTAIAHVMPADPAARQAVAFTLTVARNRGGLIGEFATTDEANQWLSSLPAE